MKKIVSILIVLGVTLQADNNITFNFMVKEKKLIQKISRELLLIVDGLNFDDSNITPKSREMLFKEALTTLDADKTTLNDPEIKRRLTNVKKLWGEYENTLVNIDFSKKSRVEAKEKEDRVSREITRDLLYITKRVDKKLYRENLKKSNDSFEKILNGFINGDTTLGLTAIKDKNISNELNSIKKLWNRYKDIIVDTSDSSLKEAIKINIYLLKRVNNLVSLYKNSIK